jgi:hypothetical protein
VRFFWKRQAKQSPRPRSSRVTRFPVSRFAVKRFAETKIGRTSVNTGGKEYRTPTCHHQKPRRKVTAAECTDPIVNL